jgi:hypothetical protein
MDPDGRTYVKRTSIPFYACDLGVTEQVFRSVSFLTSIVVQKSKGKMTPWWYGRAKI